MHTYRAQYTYARYESILFIFQIMYYARMMTTIQQYTMLHLMTSLSHRRRRH